MASQEPEKHENRGASPAPMADALAPKGDARDAADPSVELRLSMKGWLIVGGLVVLLSVGVPRWYGYVERFEPQINYRIPRSQTEDYWQVHRWSHVARESHEVLYVGDSVVWGEFAAPDESITAKLNELAEETQFANVGLKGLPPLALKHLLIDVLQVERSWLSRSGAPPRVVLHFNPIWLTSPQRDLSDPAETMVNHQSMLPQFQLNLPAYQPTWNDRLSRTISRRTAWFRWSRHLQITNFDDQDFHRWTLEHPVEWPGSTIRTVSLEPSPEPAQQARSQRTLPGTRDYDWIAADDSFQYRGFLGAVEACRQANIELYCVIGQLDVNPQTIESRETEAEILRSLERDLDQLGVPHERLPVDSKWMADASHPLPAGYQEQAQSLWESRSFQAWLAGETSE